MTSFCLLQLPHCHAHALEAVAGLDSRRYCTPLSKLLAAMILILLPLFSRQSPPRAARARDERCQGFAQYPDIVVLMSAPARVLWGDCALTVPMAAECQKNAMRYFFNDILIFWGPASIGRHIEGAHPLIRPT
jgi:hypothetical protein